MSVSKPILERGVERLENVFDLKAKVFPSVMAENEYLCEHPEERAEELMEAFESDMTSGVVAVTGGDDQIRVLKHLNADRLRANPTRFYGYSDNNNFSLYLWNLEIVSYSGGQILPSLSVDPDIHSYTKEYLDRAFFEDRLGEIQPSPEWTQELYDFDNGGPREWQDTPGWRWNCVDEQIEGRIWGGCFETLALQLQTGRYLPASTDLEGAILAIETSGEVPPPHRVRRTLMCMGERRFLEQFAAVIVGRFRTKSPNGPEKETDKYRNEQRQVIRSQVNRYNPDAAIVFGIDFGHTDPHFPLPIGGTVHLKPKEKRIIFS